MTPDTNGAEQTDWDMPADAAAIRGCITGLCITIAAVIVLGGAVWTLWGALA